MSAKIISIANQKGGVGKTTVCMNTASRLANEGARVLVADADPQGTACAWSSANNTEIGFPAFVVNLSGAEEKLHIEIRKALHQYDYILIDCPPNLKAKATRSALMISDLVLIPVIPSPGDLWATAGIQELLSDIRDTLNPAIKSLLIPNLVQPNTIMSRDVIEALKTLEIPICKTFLHNRVAYKESVIQGCSIFDIEDGENKAAHEFENFLEEVLVLLNSNHNNDSHNINFTNDTNHINCINR